MGHYFLAGFWILLSGSQIYDYRRDKKKDLSKTPARSLYRDLLVNVVVISLIFFQGVTTLHRKHAFDDYFLLVYLMVCVVRFTMLAKLQRAAYREAVVREIMES